MKNEDEEEEEELMIVEITATGYKLQVCVDGHDEIRVCKCVLLCCVVVLLYVL